MSKVYDFPGASAAEHALQLRSKVMSGHELELCLGTKTLTIRMFRGVPVAFRLQDGANLIRVKLQGSRCIGDWLSCASLPAEEFYTKLRIALRQMVMPG